MPRTIRAARIIVLVALLAAWISPASAQSRNRNLIIQLRPDANIEQLAQQHGFTVVRKLRSARGATYVIKKSGDDSGLRAALGSDSRLEWSAEDSEILVTPLGGGETVLPLGGGETVLPLGGGETVLPLGPVVPAASSRQVTSALDGMLITLGGGETVLPLDGGGETVLPLDQIQRAYEMMASRVTGSPLLLLQPAIARIGAYYTVLRNAMGNGVIVANLDTGADTCHPALQGIFTYSFVNEPRAPEDCPTPGIVPAPGYGHGTAVASLIRTVAPEATVWSVRVFDSTGTATVSTIYDAVVWATDNGAKVINMSFGTTQSSSALQDAVAYAASRGVVLTGAAGNSNLEQIQNPAGIQPAIGTAATTMWDFKASFSNYHRNVSVTAPGKDVWVAYPDNQIALVQGTSFSSALVAGEAAVVRGVYLSRSNVPPTNTEIRATIVNNTQNISWWNFFWWGKLGSGRISLPKAYRAIP